MKHYPDQDVADNRRSVRLPPGSGGRLRGGPGRPGRRWASRAGRVQSQLEEQPLSDELLELLSELPQLPHELPPLE